MESVSQIEKSDNKLKTQLLNRETPVDLKIDLSQYINHAHLVKNDDMEITHRFLLEDIGEQDCILLQVPNINESGYYSGIVGLKSYIDKYYDILNVAVIDPVIDYFFLNPPDKQGEFFNLFNTYTKQGQYWLLYEHQEIYDMVDGFISKYIEKTKASYIGFSIIDGNIDATLAIAKLVKERFPDIKVLMGGNGIQVLDFGTLPNTKYTTDKYDFIDVFVMGDGEETFVDLLMSDFSNESLQDIKGIVWWKDGKLTHNERRGNIDMESLPFPNYEPLEENYYYNSTYNTNVPLVFSRGCPYRCSFCSVPDFIPTFRYRTIDSVIDEMEHWINKGRYHFFCHDSIINGKPKWLQEFSRRVIDKGWGDGMISWGGNMRLQEHMRNIEHMELYYKAGMRKMITGFESASEPVLRHMKKYTKTDGVREIFENVRKINEGKEYPMQFAMQIIVGYLNETEEDFQRTIDFVKEYHDCMSEILTCSAFLLHEPLKKRWLNEGEKFYNFENNVVYDTDYNTTKQRIEWLDRIEETFKEIGIPYSIYNRGIVLDFYGREKR